MKTALKIIGGVVVLLVILVAAAVVVLPRMINPDQLKARAIAVVKERTGRTLSIPGKVELSVFPWLGLDVGQISLGNAPGFPGATFARSDKLSVRVKLLPLLHKRIEMDKIVLKGLTVNLERNKSGKTNWADLAGGGKPAKGGGAPSSGGGGAPALAGLAIGGLEVGNAAVSWHDARSGQSYKISKLNISTGAIEPGKPVAFNAGFDVTGGKPAMSGHVSAKATLGIDLATATYKAEGLQVKADLAGPTLPNGKVSAAVRADVTATLGKQQRLQVANLSLDGLGLKADGGLTVSGLDSKAPAYKGTLKIPAFDPRAVLKALGKADLHMADPKALTSARAEVAFAGTPTHVSLDPLTLKLDDTTLKGKVALVDIARQALRFNLAGDAIDADRYLPPPAPGGAGASGAAAPAATPGTAASAGSGLPMQALRKLDVDGKLTFGKLKVEKLNASDVAVTLKAKDGVIRLQPMSAKLYGGSYAGDVTLDARGKEPHVRVDEKLAGVQAEPLLKDLKGKAVLSGTGNVTAKLAMTGADAAAIKRTLTGDTAFSFTNGSINGINIAAMIRGAMAKLSGGAASTANEPQKTDFAELKGSVNIKNGVARNDDLSLKSPLLRVAGKGTADLPRNTVDYHVTTTLVATLKGQGGKSLDQLTGIPIPILVSGSLSSPGFAPDLQALAANLVKSKAGAVLEQQKGKVLDKLKGGLGGALGGTSGTGGTSGQSSGGQTGSGGVGGAVKTLKGLFN